MTETLDDFYNRCYVTFDWTDSKVFVYPKTRGEGKPEVWTVSQAQQYIKHLERNEVMV